MTEGSGCWAEGFGLDSLNDREASWTPGQTSDIEIVVFSKEQSDSAMCDDLEAGRKQKRSQLGDYHTNQVQVDKSLQQNDA